MISRNISSGWDEIKCGGLKFKRPGNRRESRMRSRRDGGGGKAEALLASSRNHGKTKMLTKPDKGTLYALIKVDGGREAR